MSATRRRRHRARRDDPARRGRRVDLGRPARRPLRGPPAHPGLGRAAPGPDRRAAAVDPAEVLDRVQAAPAGPLRGARADRRPGGLGRRRLPARTPTSTRSGSASRWPRASAACRPCSTRTTSSRPKGPRRVSPLTVPMLMPNGPAACVGLELGAKAGVHSPVQRLRHRRRGDRARPRHDPRRPGRRGRGRRHRGRHPPAADRRLRADAGAVDPQRRAGAGLPPVGQGPRRLRARRGRGRARAGARRARRGPRRHGLRRARRRRHHLRRVRHRAAATRGRRAPPGPCGWRSRDAGLGPGRHRPRQRARHLDPGGRHGRDRARSARRSATHPAA